MSFELTYSSSSKRIEDSNLGNTLVRVKNKKGENVGGQGKMLVKICFFRPF